MKNPFDRIKDPINHSLYQGFIDRVDLDALAVQLFEDTMYKIESRLKELNPNLLVNFNEIYQEVTFLMKEFQKTCNTIEKKSKKLFESSTLTEDVYKMRDEMKAIKKKIDNFNKGLKGLSRLSSIADEEDPK